MTQLELVKKYKLPSEVQVSVKVTSEGRFFAMLLDYPGCLTEANDFSSLLRNITDAILTYFDVPQTETAKFDIVYLPPGILSRTVEPIDRLVKAQELKQEHKNVAVMFNYFSSLHGVNSSIRR
jgi:predicted RNase H-like HicB family nuclease